MTLLSTFREKALAIILVVSLISAGIIWFGYSMGTRIVRIDNLWKEFNQRASLKAYALSRIQARLGYGGLIHDFKNYIIRKDDRLIPSIEKHLQEIYQGIDSYELLDTYVAHDNAEEELQALSRLKNVVDEYAIKFNIAKKLVAEGRTTNYIDNQVRVSDQPALEAIRILALHSKEDIGQEGFNTSQAISQAIGFMKLGGAIIPFILLAGGLMIVFLKRVLDSNENAQSALDYVDQIFESAPDAALIISKDGHITRANTEAENLLGYSCDELVQLDVEALLPDAMRQRHVGIRDKAFQQKTSLAAKTRGDFITVSKDGASLPVELNISFAEFQGELQAIVSMRDISERKRTEQEITKSQARYRAILDSAFQFIILLNPDGVVLDANISSLSFAGLNKLAVMGRPYWSTPWWGRDPEQQNIVQQAVQRALTGEVVRFQSTQLAANGELLYVDYSISPVRDSEGNIAWIVTEGRDITELHQAEDRLRLTEKVFDETVEAIIVTDGQKHIVDMNRAFSSIYGYSREELIGQLPSILSSGRHDKSFYKELWSSLKSYNHWQGEIWDKRKNGEIFPARASISVVTNDTNDTSHYVAVMSDITKIKENEAKLEQLAHYDQLTGLANRTLFYNRLQEEIARAKRYSKYLALMYIDLDGFKQVNDTLGHDAGDAVLVEASGYLNQSKREYDIAARLGGDEFALTLTDLDNADIVSTLAERVVKKLHIQMDSNDETLHVSASIGVAIFPDHGEDGESLLRNADHAMYRAKKLGKNSYQIHS